MTTPIELNPYPLVRVCLHGHLAEKFGAEHEFVIQTPRDAVHALAANRPGFVTEFAKADRYLIISDGEPRDGEDAADLTVLREVHFVPRIEGQAFLGTALITTLFPALTGTLTATILGSLLVTGVLFGISMLLRPKQPEKKVAEEKKDESYVFTGPENVTEQGAAVPLIYGRVFTGSVVVSAGLSVADVPIT